MSWFWIVTTIGLIAVELSTLKLIFIWFSLGAGVTAIVKLSVAEIGVPWQFLIFALISVLLLFVARPLVLKLISKLKKERESKKTNKTK